MIKWLCQATHPFLHGMSSYRLLMVSATTIARTISQIFTPKLHTSKQVYVQSLSLMIRCIKPLSLKMRTICSSRADLLMACRMQ